MEKKLQNPTSNKNETPAPQGGKWPDETIIRYIIRAFLLLIVFAWALVNLDAVLCFLGKVLALFTPFLIGGAIAFLSSSTNGMLLEQGVPQSSCKADSPRVPDSKHRAYPWNSICCGVYDAPQLAGIRR
mgnify:CR=1 FL=1